MMRFNGALNVDITKWASLKMQKDDSGNRPHKSNVSVDDDQPKFGAGSEYGREAREEARRRKYTSHKKPINIEDQPWFLKSTDKEKVVRKYKGVRDGGLAQHASYFIFTQAADGVFEVFPVQSWFNFTSIQKYKCLSAEEAEEEFGRRNKIMNYFSLMVSRRMQTEEGADEEEKASGKAGTRIKTSSALKVSEMEDWDDSDDKEDSEPEEDGADKGKKKGNLKKKKTKKTSDDEGLEDSDDGDGEGRELDYISDSTDSESEEEAQKKAAQIGVDQESGLKRLLDSDDSSEDEDNKDAKEEEKEDEPGPSTKDEKTTSDSKDKKKKKKKNKKTNKKDAPENLSDDEEEDEKEDVKAVDDVDSFIDPADSDSSASGANNPGENPAEAFEVDHLGGLKRKASDLFGASTGSSKKAKMEMSSTMLQSAAAEGITEDTVRRYLARKPMTATELLQKFKSKKTKISSQDMVNVIAHLLKKINPVKRMQNQKMYLFLSSK